MADASLDEILKTVELGPLSNNAEQHYNHSFYRKSLSLKGGGEPKGPLADAIKRSFGHFEAFKKKFNEVADGHFGSGWARLVRAKDDSLKMIATHDTRSPIRQRRSQLSPALCGSTPTILTIATAS